MKTLLALLAALALAGCANKTDTLAADCAAQAGAIKGAAMSITKLQAAERNSIDAQIAQSRGYCSGTVPADPAKASEVVRASTVQITATLAIANLR